LLEYLIACGYYEMTLKLILETLEKETNQKVKKPNTVTSKVMLYKSEIFRTQSYISNLKTAKLVRPY